jgi:hypothetical protein
LSERNPRAIFAVRQAQIQPLPPTATSHVSVNYTFLTVIDPKTGDSLWSDSKRWGNLYTGFHSATKGLIDELMKRVNEGER